jgi:hypothetical protein
MVRVKGGSRMAEIAGGLSSTARPSRGNALRDGHLRFSNKNNNKSVVAS